MKSEHKQQQQGSSKTKPQTKETAPHSSREASLDILGEARSGAEEIVNGAPSRITPQMAITLQSMIGNQALQRLLRRKPATQPQSTNPSPDISAATPQTVQRKVGFEFESADWYAWTDTSGNPSRNKATNDPHFKDTVRPTKRQVEPLHIGAGFELQGDDTPGPQASNIEFVTSPIETETNQSQQLTTMMDAMIVIANQLSKFTDRNARQNDAAHQYVFPEEHGLNQTDKMLSSATGRADVYVKMQATSGIRLEDVPQIMKYFSKSTPNESSDEKNERAPARSMMEAKARKDVSLGQSADWAHAAVAEMRKVHHIDMLQSAPVATAGRGNRFAQVRMRNPFSENTAKLVGFLTIVMSYLNNMALASGEELKYWQPFLARNNFAAMLDDIDPAQRAVFRQNPALMFDPVINALNAGTGLNVNRDSPVANKAFVKVPIPDAKEGATHSKIYVLQDVTIQRWLGAIAANGFDMLNKNTIAQTMAFYAQREGRGAPDPQQIGHSEDYLESQGINQPDQTGSGDALFLFENRGIVDSGKQKNEMPLQVAAALALSYLMFFHKVEVVKKKEQANQEEPGSRSFGNFPRTGMEKK